MDKKLMRSNNKKIAGVCGGIAEYFNIDPTMIRAVFAIITLFTGLLLGLIAYIVLCAIMPQK